MSLAVVIDVHQRQPKLDLRYVFNLLSVLNERSHSADVNVIGNVHKEWIKVWMLGKNSRSHAASV